MVRSRSFIATPPGETIREQLDDRGMSQKEFAARMDLSEKHISRLVNGEVQLTPEVAIRLETVLGVPARFWNNLEAIYREKIIKAEAENTMDADIQLAEQLPYSEMARFGWVPETRNAKEKVNYLRRYFEVVELPLLGNEKIARIACRRLAVTEKSDLALLAWAQEARIKAREIRTAPIDTKGLAAQLPAFRKMTAVSPIELCPEIKGALADCGVALIFLPHLKGSFLQGVSFLDGDKIVVGSTAGVKDADRSWYSFFHELAHIILGHIRQVGGISDLDEADADRWAEDMLIPPADLERLKEEKDYSCERICRFAHEQGIAPGIVVGRLQREGAIAYGVLDGLKEQYTSIGPIRQGAAPDRL